MFKEGDWVVVTKPDPEFGDYSSIVGQVLKLTEVKGYRLFTSARILDRVFSTGICLYEREVEPATDVQILAAKLKG